MLAHRSIASVEGQIVQPINQEIHLRIGLIFMTKGVAPLDLSSQTLSIAPREQGGCPPDRGGGLPSG
jgi:hypothetical protein